MIARILAISALLIALRALPFHAFAEDGDVRIAILAESPELDGKSDFLFAELSKYPGLVLLERSRIDYVLKEHEILLSEAPRRGVEVGRLLGADGLVVVGSLEVDGGKYLTARLAGVKAGVVLDLAVFPETISSEVATWARLAAGQLAATFPKLKLGGDELLPISVLNVRCVTPVLGGVETAVTIGRLLSMALTGFPEIVVTDRWSLEKLAVEKLFDDGWDAKFLTGKFVLDGEASILGERVELALRLSPGGGLGEERLFEFSGKIDALGELAMEMANRIAVEVTSGKTVGTNWSFNDEIARLREEAAWALRNADFATARSAADAAWALGDSAHETAFTRLRAYGGEEFHRERSITQRINRVIYEVSCWLPLVANPEAELRNCLQLLLIYEDYLRKMPEVPANEIVDYGRGQPNPGNIHPHKVLIYASRILESAAAAGLHNDSRNRSIIATIQDSLINVFDLSIEIFKEHPIHQELTYGCLFLYGRFWFPSPEDFLRKIQELMAGEMDKELNIAQRMGLAISMLVHMPNRWDSAGDYRNAVFHEKHPQMPAGTERRWQQYLDRLLNSGNDSMFIDGVALSLMQIPLGRNRLASLNAMLDKHYDVLLDIIARNVANCGPEDAAYGEVLIASLLVAHGKLHGSREELDYDEFERVLELAASLMESNKNVPWKSVAFLLIQIRQEFFRPSAPESTRRIAHRFLEAERQAIGGHRPWSNAIKIFVDSGLTKIIDTPAKPKSVAEISGGELLKSGIVPYPGIAPETSEYGVGVVDYYRLVVKDGRLFAMGQVVHPTRSGKNPQDFVTIYDPRTGESKTIIVPHSFEGNAIVLAKRLRSWWGGADIRKRIGPFTIIPCNSKQYDLVMVSNNGMVLGHGQSHGGWEKIADLQVADIIDATIVGDSLFASFSQFLESGKGVNDIRKPCGILRYSFDNAETEFLATNQRLTGKNRIEQAADIFRITDMMAAPGRAYFIYERPDGKSIHNNVESILGYYDLKDGKFGFVGDFSIYRLVANNHGGVPTMANANFKFVTSDFESMENKLDTENFGYYSEGTPPVLRWEINEYGFWLGSEFVRNEDAMFLFVNPNSDCYRGNITIFHWSDGLSKPKAITTGCPRHTGTSMLPVNLAAADAENLFFRYRFNRGERQLPISHVPIREVNSYLARKLDYPRVYPYGWSYHPTEKHVPFLQRLRVSIERQYDDATIRHTTDGSVPSADSPIYDGQPLVIDKNTTLTARVFKDGWIPSDPFRVQYRRAKPGGILAAKIEGESKDTVLVRCGYLLKSPEDAEGVSKHVIPPPRGEAGTPLAGDWNGDGFSRFAYHQGNHVNFYLDGSRNEPRRVRYPVDLRKHTPLVGDWNGDGRDTIAWIDGAAILHIDDNGDGKPDREIAYKTVEDAKFIVGNLDHEGHAWLFMLADGKLLADSSLDGAFDIEIHLPPVNENSQYLVGDWNGDGRGAIAIWDGETLTTILNNPGSR